MTFSIAGRCARTNMFGIALSSSSPAVAARCAHARAGIGVVATQNVTDPRLGPIGLDLLALKRPASAVVAELWGRAGDTAPYRQITAIDSTGATAAFSGEKALGTFGDHSTQDAVAAGNMLARRDIPRMMTDAFHSHADEHLAVRLLAGLDAALAAGGESGPLHSAGLLVVDEVSWPLVDLRVDWDDAPIARLRALWGVWRPQMSDYVVRGLDPTAAPSYGVPGDP